MTTPDRGPFPAIHPVEAMAMPIAGQRSGILTLRSGPKWHDVSYVLGKANRVESSSVDESLPMLMAESKALERNYAIELINRMRENNADPFEEMLARGVITNDKLRMLMKWRALLLLERATAFRKGSFSFREIPAPRLPGPELDLKLPSLLRANLIEQDDRDDLQQRLTPWLGATPRLTSNPATGPTEFGFKKADAELLRHFDGNNKVRDVLATTSMPPSRAVPTVWLMLVSGALAAPVAQAAEPATASTSAALAVPPDGAPDQPEDTQEVTPPELPEIPDDVEGEDAIAAVEGRVTALGQSLFGDNFNLDKGARDAITAATEAYNKEEAAKELELDEDFGDEDEGTLDRDQRSRLIELSDTLDRLEAANFLDVLGLTPECSTADVRTAYLALARQYHPDHFTGEPGALRRKIQAIFARISEANTTLEKETKRKAYIDKVIYGKKDANEIAMEQARKLMEAEAAYKMGVRLLNAGQIKPAQAKFEAAMSGDVEEPEYRCYWAYTNFLLTFGNDKEKAEEAAEMVKEAANQSHNPRHVHLLAKAKMRQGDDEYALELLRRVLRRQRGNEEALREYRECERRITKAKAPGALAGLFSRFRK